MPAPEMPDTNADPPPTPDDLGGPRAALRRLGVLRVDSLLLTATVLLYLSAAGATTWITWSLGYEDWFLYAVMSLCTATAITNYSVLKPRAPGWLRLLVWAFALAVIGGWTLLLFEKTQVGWVIIDGEAVDHGRQGWFYLPVGLNLLCAAMLTGHLLWIAPRARAEATARIEP